MVVAAASPTHTRTISLGQPRVRALAGLAVVCIALVLCVRPATTVTRSPDWLSAGKYSGGFYHPETDARGVPFVWTQGKAETRFDLTSYRPLRVIVALRSAATVGGPDAPVMVRINGRAVQAIRPDPARPDFQIFAVPLPRSDDPSLTVSLLGPTFQPAGENRAVGIMVQSIAVDTRDAWAAILGRMWLYWLVPVCGALAWLLLGAAERVRRRSTLAGYGAVACCAVAAACMAVALLLLTRIGEVDRNTYYLWWLCTLCLALLFAGASVALPLGGASQPSAYARLTQSAVVRDHRAALLRLRDGCLVVLPFLFSLHFIGDIGTSDVGDKLKWMQNMRQYGVIAGYRANENVYPPFTQLILALFQRIADVMGWSDYFALKVSLALALAVTSAVLLRWSRSAPFVAVMELGLTVNTMALGYTDIYFAPTLLVALWALRARRIPLFTLAFAVTCLIKWQAAIIAPFALLYVVQVVWARQRGWEAVKALLLGVVLPASLLAGGVLAVFGDEPLATLGRGASESFLSANALNFGWIITVGLHLFRPGIYGPLNDASESVKMNKEFAIGIPSRILVVLFYGYTLYRSLRGPRTYASTLHWMFGGYVAYFLFNTSVHENHLFPAALIGAAIFINDRRRWWPLAATMVMLNVNLVLFYGLNGIAMAPTPFIGPIDLALVLSALNVVLFIVWFCRVGSGQQAAGSRQ